MLSLGASRLLNVTLYQLGWFCCVLGGAWGYPLAGAILALLPVLVHLLLAESRVAELSLMLVACLLGVLVDSAQQALGVFTFRGSPDWPLWLPLWVFIIWAQFATLFHYALHWLAGRYLLGALLGTVGGPLAYSGGVRLGAAEFGENLLFSLGSLAVVWSLMTPLLIWLASRIGGKAASYRQRPWSRRRRDETQ
ncbi:membrane protein [Desulfuromonas versatilis]|uniref:Membrane protein n=1 Tax=Desulfuromonas versatilis TaxID=2802975 RepID=A0ABM7ND00_9BACT|nr:DUF2878 domain-containing protein [Desulfuromonas versatilis]BCR04947.1 membrane protein [Desulfuromonas versatilis]